VRVLCGIVAVGDDTIDARDGYVDAVHCGNGRDTVMADEKDAVSETCEDVSPPPEEDRTVTLTVLLNEEGQARLDPRYPYGLIEIHLGRWLRLQPGFEFTYCRPTCSYEGPGAGSFRRVVHPGDGPGPGRMDRGLALRDHPQVVAIGERLRGLTRAG